MCVSGAEVGDDDEEDGGGADDVVSDAGEGEDGESVGMVDEGEDEGDWEVEDEDVEENAEVGDKDSVNIKKNLCRYKNVWILIYYIKH